MAVITSHAFNLNMFWWDMRDVGNARLESGNATSLALVHDTQYPWVYTFKYGGTFGGYDDAGVPSTGKITSFENWENDAKTYSITGMNMTVAAYFNYAATNNTEGFMKALLAGADTVNGSGTHDKLFALAGNDTIYGNGGNDLIYGGVGNDILNGGDGFDTLTYEDSTTRVAVNLFLTAAQNTGVGGGTDTITNFEGLIGSIFDDQLIGNNADNVIEGRDGGDFLLGGGGNDRLLGGLGFDIVGFQNGPGVNVTLQHSGWQNTGQGTDLLVGIEGLVGSSNPDTLVGDHADNYIEGGAGNDFLVGNDGFDVLSYRASAVGVTVNLSLTSAQVVNGGTGETDTVTGFEYLYGSDFNDILIGGSFDDGFAGYAGNDDINGGDGHDFVSYLGANAAVTISLATADWQNTGGAGTDRLTSIESVLGSNFNDNLTGSAGDDVLGGGGGNDILNGGEGFDYAYYGADTTTTGVKVNLSLTTAQATVGAGTDTLLNIEGVYGSRFNDIITGSAGANTIHGYGGDDKINGGGGDDDIRGDADPEEWVSRTGISGNDILNGGAGNDRLMGGAGNDVIDGDGGIDWAYYNETAVGITASLTTGVADGDGHDTLVEIENIWGSMFNDVLEGNALANNLVGEFGDDILMGLGGNDLLEAASGNDTVLGGDGADAAYGHAGDDVVEGGTGNDLVSGGSGNDIVRGDDGDDIVRGDWGMDSIYGGLGNDTLNGGVGNDLIDGGDGVDTVTYDDATARVVVDLIDSLPRNTGGAGKDTLVSIENLTGSGFNDILRGSDGANRVDGGAGNDTIVGRGGDDVLLGGEGNDTLTGGLGKDTLTGGGGGDTFVFGNGDSLNTSSATRDFITDYSSAAGDKIDLSGIDGTVTFASAFTGVAGQALLTASGANTLLRIDVDGDKVVDFGLLISGTVTSSDAGWIL
jgi:Ca2+-binding RTX toxin-like protein